MRSLYYDPKNREAGWLGECSRKMNFLSMNKGLLLRLIFAYIMCDIYTVAVVGVRKKAFLDKHHQQRSLFDSIPFGKGISHITLVLDRLKV